MGTFVEYTVLAEDSITARKAVDRAHEEVRRIDRLLWEEDSGGDIFVFNTSISGSMVSRETFDFLQRSSSYSQTSKGAFDMTIGPALALYHFGDPNGYPPESAMVSQQTLLVGIDGIILTNVRSDSGYVGKSSRDITLAVGGVAKGYAVDRAIAVLRANGVRNALVNAGGDLYCLGTSPAGAWRIGIRDPRARNEVSAVLLLSNKAVATSGDYEQYFEHNGIRYHHILDPKTGWPARTSMSSTVIAATAEKADAMATAMFVLGPLEGISLANSLSGIEAMIIDTSGVTFLSEGMSSYLESEPAGRSGKAH